MTSVLPIGISLKQPQTLEEHVYLFCYTAVGQMVSVCNYWNGKSDY